MISICILTKNAASTLKSTLDSVKTFSQVIVLDNGSTDETCQIAQSYPNITLHKSPFIGFGPLRNLAASLSQNDWILFLDSDEILSDKLLLEIKALTLDPTTAYVLPRHNYYNGKLIWGCGWENEHVARLYHRGFARYSDAMVHESLLANKKTYLNHPLLHTPYQSIADFLSKMQHYSTLFAEQNRDKRRSSFTKALIHGSYAFFRSYFLKRGIFCGKEGFIISFYNGTTTFFKYLKLAENRANHPRGATNESTGGR